jgi:hypothetical protein
VPLLVGVVLNAHPAIAVACGAWLAAAAASIVLARLFGDRRMVGIPALAVAVADISALASAATSIVVWALSAIAVIMAGRQFASSDSEMRIASELAAIGHLFVVVAAIGYLTQPAGWTPVAAALLMSAAALAPPAALSASRRWWRWLSGGAAELASCIESAVHRVHAPEAYTFPAGVLVLAFGISAVRRQPGLSSWLAYAPGLTILTSPSLVLALHEPLSWRAVAVGIAALLILAAGAGFQLQAPMVIGSTQLAVLAMREVAPYAMALPRWSLIGGVGVLLVLVGVSWERRVQNVAQAQRALAAMR